MNWHILLAAFSLLVLFPAHSKEVEAKKSVSISLIRKNGNQARMILSHSNEGFICESEGMPRHKILVENLRSLNAPFETGQTKNCRVKIDWDGKVKCYERGHDLLVDRVIRWCTTP